jgi:hypothetical protein
MATPESDPSTTDDAAPGGDHDGNDSPSLRQRVHAATGDRDREARALADRSSEDVTEQDAKVAVNRAHGDSTDGVRTDDELAGPDDAADAHEEGGPGR